MTGRKVKLALISDDSARRATYNRRKKSIVKKVTELTTLCDIPACAIISNPFNSQIEFWPNQEGAKTVIERYQSSSMKDLTRNVNHERFVKQMIDKSMGKLRNLKQENRDNELNCLMFEHMQNNKLSDNLSAEELDDFDKFVEKKLKEADDAINKLN